MTALCKLRIRRCHHSSPSSMTEPRHRYNTTTSTTGTTNTTSRSNNACSNSSTTPLTATAAVIPLLITRSTGSRFKRRNYYSLKFLAKLLFWALPVTLIILWWCVALSWPTVPSSFVDVYSHIRSTDDDDQTRLPVHGERFLPVANEQVKSSGRLSNSNSNHASDIIAIYMESPSTLQANTQPLPVRSTNASKLVRIEFPQLRVDCDSGGRQYELPVDSFPETDPFLPWLHDYHVDAEVTHARFVAQNKRRCDTGTGKEAIMKYWEPQISLFQPIPVMREETIIQSGIGPTIKERFRLATLDANATAPETRFLCQFRWSSNHEEPNNSQPRNQVTTTLSVFEFNYEFAMWRKHRLPMYLSTGSDVSKLEMSQLLFSCPIPKIYRQAIRLSLSQPAVRLDLVPIRTPPRFRQQLFGLDHIGASQLALEQANGAWFNASESFGTNHILPDVVDSGRWANLPICRPSLHSSTAEPNRDEQRNNDTQTHHRHYLVACTWTAASYFRRGDATTINDSANRLKEWIVFHQMVGVDHMYVYDNTKLDGYRNNSDSGTSPSQQKSPLWDICALFPASLVTYISWPASVCSNNRPNHQNPGERSSQYAADTACRSKYGDQTEWMTFIDTDEYLVPMRRIPSNGTAHHWHGILREYDATSITVLKLKSSRGRPRLDKMDVTDDPNICVRRNRRVNKLAEPTCAVPRRNATFLQVYNCDYIKHPRPERFSRAMKQIYKPASVISHFVHYSLVNVDIARYYNDLDNRIAFNAVSSGRWDFNEKFLDELSEGVMIHAKSVLPHETMTRTKTCHNASKHTCSIGYACPDAVKFDDEIHQMNLFHDFKGKYCNCWVDNHVESYWVPLLELELAKYYW